MTKKANTLLVKFILSFSTIIILTIAESLVSTHLYSLEHYKLWCDIAIVFIAVGVSVLYDYLQNRKKKRVQRELKEITDVVLKKYDKK